MDFRIICPKCTSTDVSMTANSTVYSGSQGDTPYYLNSTILIRMVCRRCEHTSTTIRYGVGAKRKPNSESEEEVISDDYAPLGAS